MSGKLKKDATPEAEPPALTKAKKKLTGALYGVALARQWPEEKDFRSYSGLESIPSYILKLAIVIHFRTIPRSDWDKSDWASCLTFNKASWILRDRRRHRVDLTGNPGREADALALAKKLRSAVSIVDTLFANIAGEERDKERFVLVNEKHRFESMYEYFQMRCKALGKEHNQLQKRSIPSRKSGRKGTSKKTVSDHLSDIAKHFNHSTRLLKEVEYNTLAAVGAYFSMTEVIMDAKYCMMEKQVTYKEFRRLDWYERMKSLATWTNEELKVILDVKRIRDSMRNRSFHFAPIYYFPMPLVGLIPASYENLTPQGFGDFPSRETLGVSASTFTKLDSLLDLLKASPETELSYLYADSSLPLMLDFAQDSLSGHTGSKRKFKEEILRRNRMQDAIDNMEV